MTPKHSIVLFLLLALPTAAWAGDEDAEKRLKAGDRDPAFLLKVNEAVRKGMEWVLKQQDEDGSFSSKLPLEGFPAGPTALALLTVLKSGVSRHDPAIQKGFDWLRKQPLKRTYTVGLTLMALEAMYSPQDAEKRIQGHTQAAAPARANIPLRDLEWMKELTVYLLENMAYSDGTTTNGVVTSKKNSWHYPNGPDGQPAPAGAVDVGDHSNTQYAILGLRSAQRCGVAVPRDVWEDVWVLVADHFLDVQETDGPSVVRMKMLEDREHGYVSYKTVTSVPDKARGWAYSANVKASADKKDHMDATTGSMTSVGVASLIIAMDGLYAIRSTKLNASRQAAISKSVNDGLAWLTHKFTVETNPGHPTGSWFYYYMYGLERASVLAGVRNLGTHDWYREGADWLVGHQAGNGTWTVKASMGGLADTCFALLFLTKATVPGRVKITR